MNCVLAILAILHALLHGKNATMDSFPPVEPEIFDSYFIKTDLEEYPDVCYEYESEACATAWLQRIDIIRKRNNNRIVNIQFKYSVDISEENKKLEIDALNQNNQIIKRFLEKIKKFKWKHFRSPEIKRKFHLLTPTIVSRDDSVTERLINVTKNMEDIYNHGRPCFSKCLVEGEAGIVELFRVERNYDKLAGFWSAWRNETGRKVKGLFIERVRLENIGAKENGYADAQSFKLEKDFEESNFNGTVLNLFEEILPLYKQLHGYVRYCLSKFYPNRFDERGPIPAHILGNVWGQEWSNILPIIQRCHRQISKENIQTEVDKNLRQMSIKEMFLTSEEFFQSIGMFKMTPQFWERSVFEQQPGKIMDCHGSANDFSNGVDFRIKMCTNKTIDDFTTIHHEMGHIEYFMAFRSLPEVFQDSPNSGFHEAIGDTIALSVKTPEHLKKVGLIEKIPTSEQFDIDYLLVTALEKVVFLPFALMMDSYMWAVSNGSVPYNQLNQYWWDLINRYQGLGPPSRRSENDFDPGAKYHITFGVPYIRYFVSFLLQFQFYESMCDLSNHSGPLHRCDFYESKIAGKKMLEMLSLGRGRQWKDCLEILTNEREISSKSLLRFFEPLHKWLLETNERLNIPIGW